MKRYLLAAAAAVTLTLGGTGANASLVSCPAGFTASGTAKVHDGGGAPNITAASACQYVTPADPSNVATLDNINGAGFFGHDDWQSNGQTQINSNAESGTWSIANAMFNTRDYIIVFKSGNNTNLTAFLFNENYTSGGWNTPFTDPPFSFPGNADSRAVSHYTIAYRTTGDTPPPTDVPEPMTLGLLGLGLLGMGAVTRRRRA
jgi:hypothetical protein